MSSIKNLTIDRIEERTRKDNGDKFPVLVVEGINFAISESGNSRIELREVFVPLSNMSMAQAKEYFPSKSKLEGYEIFKRQVEPYEWESPDGRILSLTHSWDIRKVDETTEATMSVPAKSSSLEKHVFAGSSSRKNDLEPAL